MMKPEPKVTKRVCTLCGLDWGLHGEKPTAEKCVELLRAELAKHTQPLTAQWQGTTFAARPTISYGEVVRLHGNDIGKAQ